MKSKLFTICTMIMLLSCKKEDKNTNNSLLSPGVNKKAIFKWSSNKWYKCDGRTKFEKVYEFLAFDFYDTNDGVHHIVGTNINGKVDSSLASLMPTTPSYNDTFLISYDVNFDACADSVVPYKIISISH